MEELRFNQERSFKIYEETIRPTSTGRVYRAQDAELNRDVFIKEVNIDPEKWNEQINSVKTEVKLLVRLSNETHRVPYILEIFEDRTKSVLIMIMQLIRGQTLNEKMEKGGISRDSFLDYMIQLCDLLILMDRQNLHHKDIKPENIIIDNKNALYLIDFNITNSRPNLTEGTVGYMAPEMFIPSLTSIRKYVDQFSVGVMLYEFFTGSCPVYAKDYGNSLRSSSKEWVKYVNAKEKNNSISDSMDKIIAKCMMMDPERRYRNNQDLKSALVAEKRGAR